MNDFPSSERLMSGQEKNFMGEEKIKARFQDVNLKRDLFIGLPLI